MATENAPPGPDGLPLVGNTHQFAPDPLGFYERLAEEYGPVARFRAGGDTFVQLSDPSLIEQVLVHENQRYRKGELYQQALGPVLGEGLLLSEGEFWRQQRHRIQSSFAPDALKSYTATMVEATERQLSAWEDGEVRAINQDMMSLTVDIVARTLFDVDVREYRADIAEALEAVMDRSEERITSFVKIPDWVPTATNRRHSRAVATLDEIAADIIDAHEPGTEGVVPTLLAAMAEDERVDEQQIRDEVVTLLLAGHETTSLALSYTLFALAHDPDSQAAVHAEVDDVLDERAPTATDDLPVTERTITEGMRLYPPVQDILREAAEPVDLGGYEFAEGTTFSMQQWVLHRDPRFYDDPLTFRPSRWEQGLQEDLPAFAYFPFSGGPRRCVGDRFARLESRLVLATIARDWRVTPDTQTLSFVPSITLRTEESVRLRIHER